jgi:hypothetical protein
MTLVRAQVIFSGLSRTPTPRRLLVVSGLQIVDAGRMKRWTDKEFFLRNPPFTAVSPTDAQLDIRGSLTNIARAMKGVKGLQFSSVLNKYLPGAAAAVADTMKGYHSPYYKGPTEQRTYHTGAEILDMAAARGVKVGFTGPRAAPRRGGPAAPTAPPPPP